MLERKKAVPLELPFFGWGKGTATCFCAASFFEVFGICAW